MRTGHISKKSRQREQLVLALLQQPSLAKAAASIGISTTTAWRICQTSEFQEADGEARRDDNIQFLGRLQHGTGRAASTLLSGLVDQEASDAARVRTALGVLEQGGRGAPSPRRRPKREAQEAPSPKPVTWEEFEQQYNARQAAAAPAGHPSRTSKASRQREKFIRALLEQPNREQAAAAIGVSIATAWRMSKTPEFEAGYRVARRADYSRTLARLAHARGAALSVLERVMVDKRASWADRGRAAQCILDQTGKALEREELALPAGPPQVGPREAQNTLSSLGQVTWQEFCEMYKARQASQNGQGPSKNEMTITPESS